MRLEPQKVSPRAAPLPVFFQLVKLPFRKEAEASSLRTTMVREFVIINWERIGTRPWRRVTRPLASTSVEFLLSLGSPTCESLCLLISPTFAYT